MNNYIYTRRSIRKYSDKDVTRELIEQNGERNSKRGKRKSSFAEF